MLVHLVPHELEIVVSVDTRALGQVRRMVGEWVAEVLSGDDEDGWRAEMASHELLERVLHRATDGTARLSISVVSDGEYRRIIVSSHSRATHQQVAELTRAVADVRGAPDRLAYYQDLLRRSVAREDDAALGLARIAAEAEMELDSFAYREELTVVAHTTVKEKR